MIHVQYPEPRFKIKKEGDKPYLFDTFRKAWILLTEEEWVRQNFILYLVDILHYPSSFIALEKEILLNGLKKRFDILVYNKEHEPWMMVECKAPNIALNEAVMQQLLRYHLSVPAAYLVITNGTQTYAWKKESGSLQEMEQLPNW